MNIQSTQFHNSPYRRPQARCTTAEQPEQAEPQESFSFSFRQKDRFATTRKAMGGAVAGAVYSSVLSLLPLSITPAFGISKEVAGVLWGTTIVAGGLAGGFASATMPEGRNWF